TWETLSARVTQVVFAPASPVCAVFVIFLVANRGPEKLSATLLQDTTDSKTLTLAAGQEGAFESVVDLGGGSELSQMSALDWFRRALSFQAARYGTLAIAEAPFFAESVVRFAENCRQSLLLASDGLLGGGFLGSDVDARDVTWNRDTFYNV